MSVSVLGQSAAGAARPGAPTLPPVTRTLSAAGDGLSGPFAALPRGEGRAETLHAGRGPLSILHVQDIHGHAEAQARMRRAVAAVLPSSDLLALEGAAGEAALEALRTFPVVPARDAAVDFLLRENRLSGPAAAALGAGRPVAAIGIDDAVLHDANAAAYRAARALGGHPADRLARRAAEIDREIEAHASPACVRWNRFANARREGSMSLSVYLGGLPRFPGASTPMLERFLAAARAEAAIDERAVERGRAMFLDKLCARLGAGELAALENAAVDLRAGRRSAAEFYADLVALARRRGVAVRDPAFGGYLEYIRLADGIEPGVLFRDVAGLEARAEARASVDAADRARLAERAWLHLASKLVRFSLNRDEWERFASQPIPSTVPAALVKPHLDFYRIAVSRDAAMAAALREAVRRSGARAAVVVTGGFHARGLRDAFPDATWTTWTPRITGVATVDGTVALTAFARERTPLDRLFDGDKLFLAPDPWSPRSLRMGDAVASAAAMKGGAEPGYFLTRISRLLGWPAARWNVSGARARILPKGGGAGFDVEFGDADAIRDVRLATGDGHIGAGPALARVVGLVEASTPLEAVQRAAVRSAIDVLRALEPAMPLEPGEREMLDAAVARLEALFDGSGGASIGLFAGLVNGPESYVLAAAVPAGIYLTAEFFTPPFLPHLPEILLHEALASLYGEADYGVHRARVGGVQRRLFGAANPLAALLRGLIESRLADNDFSIDEEINEGTGVVEHNIRILDYDAPADELARLPDMLAEARLETSELLPMDQQMLFLRALRARNTPSHMRKPLKDVLVARNRRLVQSIANSLVGARNPAYEDAVSDGYLGLIRAVELYDARRGFQLGTYATWWIRQHIQRGRHEGRLVRAKSIGPVIAAIRRLLAGEGNGNLGFAEIAERVGTTVRKVREAWPFIQGTSSIEPKDDESQGIAAALSDEEEPDPTEVDDNHQEVMEFLSNLDPIHQLIIKLRHGIGVNNREEMTLNDIGLLLGVTRERIRQMQSRAMAAMRVDAPDVMRGRVPADPDHRDVFILSELGLSPDHPLFPRLQAIPRAALEARFLALQRGLEISFRDETVTARMNADRIRSMPAVLLEEDIDAFFARQIELLHARGGMVLRPRPPGPVTDSAEVAPVGLPADAAVIAIDRGWSDDAWFALGMFERRFAGAFWGAPTDRLVSDAELRGIRGRRGGVMQPGEISDLRRELEAVLTRGETGVQRLAADLKVTPERLMAGGLCFSIGERQWTILRHSYGIGTPRLDADDEIAGLLDTTSARVRNMRYEALKALRAGRPGWELLADALGVDRARLNDELIDRLGKAERLFIRYHFHIGRFHLTRQPGDTMGARLVTEGVGNKRAAPATGLDEYGTNQLTGLRQRAMASLRLLLAGHKRPVPPPAHLKKFVDESDGAARLAAAAAVPREGLEARLMALDARHRAAIRAFYGIGRAPVASLKDLPSTIPGEAMSVSGAQKMVRDAALPFIKRHADGWSRLLEEVNDKLRAAPITLEQLRRRFGGLNRAEAESLIISFGIGENRLSDEDVLKTLEERGVRSAHNKPIDKMHSLFHLRNSAYQRLRGTLAVSPKPVSDDGTPVSPQLRRVIDTLDASPLPSAAMDDGADPENGEPTSALGWGNLVTAAGVGLMGGVVFAPADPFGATLAAVFIASGILASFLLHEDAHRRAAGMRWGEFGFVAGGVGFRGAPGLAGIRMSAGAAAALLLAAPFFPVLWVLVAVNVIFALSSADWRDVFASRRGRRVAAALDDAPLVLGVEGVGGLPVDAAATVREQRRLGRRAVVLVDATSAHTLAVERVRALDEAGAVFLFARRADMDALISRSGSRPKNALVEAHAFHAGAVRMSGLVTALERVGLRRGTAALQDVTLVVPAGLNWIHDMDLPGDALARMLVVVLGEGRDSLVTLDALLRAARAAALQA